MTNMGYGFYKPQTLFKYTVNRLKNSRSIWYPRNYSGNGNSVEEIPSLAILSKQGVLKSSCP